MSSRTTQEATVSDAEVPIRWDVLATVVAVLIAGFWAGRVAIQDNHHEDLWIYSSGGWLGFHGQTPYDTERIHARVAEQYDDVDLIRNCGFFLAPQAMLPFAPFAYLPWLAAKLLWCMLTIGLAAAAAWQFRHFTSSSILPNWFTAAAVVAVLLNPLSMFVLIVGQTPLFVVSCVLLGQSAHVRGKPHVGCFLWGLTFIKPHIALPLLAVAWCVSGWRRAVEVAAWAGLLNMFAGWVTVGDPLQIREYLAYLPKGHQSVEFNRVAVNKQITAWTRLVVANGGPTIELNAFRTLMGYMLWLTFAAKRVWLSGHKPNPSWVLAMAACGALLCCQLLPYELPILVLVIPYLGDLLSTGRRRDRVVFLAIVLVAAYAMLPGGDADEYGRLSPAEWVAYRIGGAFDAVLHDIGINASITNVLLSHRSVGVAAIATIVLIWGSRGGQGTVMTSYFPSFFFRAGSAFPLTGRPSSSSNTA